MTRPPKKPARMPRAKPKDFRVKLKAEDYDIVIAAIAEKGFEGTHAKQDWLRSLIPGMSPAKPAPPARGDDTTQRLPMPGGQQALAQLANVGTDLREMKRDLNRMRDWMLRIDPVFIKEEHRERVQNELPVLLFDLMLKLNAAEATITPRLVPAIDAVHKVLSR